MANVTSYNILVYGGPSGYQTNRAQTIIVWRLTHFLVVEDGPLDITIKLRKALGINFLNKLVSCFYCSSVWIGFAGAVLASGQPKEIVMLSFYYSGVAILLERITNKQFS